VLAVGSFRRVLVGFDGSPDAAEALWVGASVAATAGGGKIAVLCVLPRALPPEGKSEGTHGGLLLAQAEALLDELASNARPGILVRTSVDVAYSDGDGPGNVVTLYAQEQKFDVLVLGRHGSGSRGKSSLGRVADHAVRACSVPLLLVSAPNGKTAPGRRTMAAPDAATP